MAEAWIFTGKLRFWLGESPADQEALERAMAYARQSGNRRAHTAASTWLGSTFMTLPVPADAAVGRAEQLLQAADGDPWARQRAVLGSGRGASAASCPGVPATAPGEASAVSSGAAAPPARPVRKGESDLPFAQLAFQYRDLVAQDQGLGVLVPIAHRNKTQDRERVRHSQVGQSQQHSRSSCRDDHLAVAIPVLYRGDDARHPGLPMRHDSHLHGMGFRHAHGRRPVSQPGSARQTPAGEAGPASGTVCLLTGPQAGVYVS